MKPSTIPSVLRLASLIALLSAIASLCLLRQARAAVDEAMLHFGSSLMEYPNAKEEAVRQLHLNGARVYFRTQTVDAPSHAVLDHYEALCDGRDGFLAQRLSELLATHPRVPDHAAMLRSIATTAVRDGGRGYVACLDMGGQALSLDSLVSRFARFARTGDLHEIGHARYAYAQPVEGSDSRTFLLTMWTAADFNLYDILPLEGRDAAGSDLTQVPRPPNSQRILSSNEVGYSNAVAVYLARASSPSTLERFYREAFRARDWDILERHSGERLQVNQTSLVAAQRAGETITVLAHPGALDRTVVTILKAGTP